MRYRGWSLVLIFFCGVSYAYYSRDQTKSKKTPRASTGKTSHWHGRMRSIASLTLRSSSSPYLYQGQDPAVAAAVNGFQIQTTVLNQRTQYVLDRTRLSDESRLSDQDRQQRFDRARWQMLEQMIEELLISQLAQDAEAVGTIQIPSEHIPGHVLSWRTQYPTDEQFQRAFPQHLGTLDDFVKDTLRRAALHNHIRAQITVTQSELQAYYQDHRDEFNEFGRILSFEEAQQRGWVSRSVMGAKQQQEMGRQLEQKRRNSTIVVSLTPPAQ